MAKGRRCDPEVARAAHRMRNEGCTYSKIGRTFGHQGEWARRTIADYDSDGQPYNRKKRERPRVTSILQDCQILAFTKLDRTGCVKDITRTTVDGEGPSVSHSTFHRRLREWQGRNVTAVRDQLNHGHKIARIAWCQSLLDPTKHPNLENYLARVVFSDEVMFTLKGGKIKIWIFDGETRHNHFLQVREAYGRISVMFWGAISAFRPVNLTRLRGMQNSQTYRVTLEDALFDFRTAWVEKHGIDYVFMQDNAPCHKSGYMIDFFKREEIELLPWPTLSPDLNPIENSWGWMKKHVTKRAPKNEEELCQYVQEAWEACCTAANCARLYGSMTSRLEAVILNDFRIRY